MLRATIRPIMTRRRRATALVIINLRQGKSGKLTYHCGTLAVTIAPVNIFLSVFLAITLTVTNCPHLLFIRATLILSVTAVVAVEMEEFGALCWICKCGEKGGKLALGIFHRVRAFPQGLCQRPEMSAYTFLCFLKITIVSPRHGWPVRDVLTKERQHHSRREAKGTSI